VSGLPVAQATVGHTSMVAETFKCRGDGQRKSTRYRAARWSKYGVRDVVLFPVGSLRLSIKKAAQFDAQVYREATVYSAMLRK
jgi:hypothetical protein